MYQPKTCLSLVIVAATLIYIMLSVLFGEHIISSKHLVREKYTYANTSWKLQGEMSSTFSTLTLRNTTDSFLHSIRNITDADNFGQIANSEIYVREIFVDKRYNPPRITVLAIAPVKRKKVYCHSMYINRNEVLTTMESNNYYSLGNVPPYCYFKSYLIYCPLPTLKRTPQLVGLTVHPRDKQFHIRMIKVIAKHGYPEQDFGICLPKIFGMKDTSADKMIEFLELQRILGVKHAMLYDVENSSNRVSQVVQHYQNVGFISVIPWILPVPNLDKYMYKNRDFVAPPGTEPDNKFSEHNPYCVRRHAQALSNFHCHLSNIHHYKYLAYPDLDEVFMPRMHRTLPQLFEHLEKNNQFQKSASAVFVEAYFCVEGKNEYKNRENGNVNISTNNGSNHESFHSNNHTITLNMFSNIRKPVVYPTKKLQSPKTILKPEKTNVILIHTVQSAMSDYHLKFIVNSSLATKNHYRIPNHCQADSKIIVDNVLDPYIDELKHNVQLTKLKLT